MNGAEDARPWTGGWTVIARIGDRRIAFPAAEVRSILPIPPLWRPPTAPRPVFGFLPLDGAVLPVLNGGVLLGVPTPEHAGLYAHILILPQLGEAGAGLLVDRAEEAIVVPEEAILPLDPADTLNSCAIALAETDEGRVHVLSAARLLAAAEREALAALGAEAARRLGEWRVPA
ncbi:chemotaxis protein CheW [Sphingomonas sp. AP4-R1]|uniref:chemotaxis protein CheW n=1 Tax=Sphingomonas sp. AP4-R1 TaxID=2735134 RepID=UPI0014938C28|nr:chemotaxis protein CheW [Sphingomonas sp. AP4-R1]QJU56943.1 chemotaxis protein CheW [Sphingomonas sp. AP4-R1]